MSFNGFFSKCSCYVWVGSLLHSDRKHLLHDMWRLVLSFSPSSLLQCQQNELRIHLPTLLIDPEQHGPLPAGIGKLTYTLQEISGCQTALTLNKIWSCLSCCLWTCFACCRYGAEDLDEHYVSFTLLPGQPHPHYTALLPALPFYQCLALQSIDEPGGQRFRLALPLLGSCSPSEAHGHWSLGWEAGPGVGCWLPPGTHYPGQAHSEYQ